MRHWVFHDSYRARGRGPRGKRRRADYRLALVVMVAMGGVIGVTAANVRPAELAAEASAAPADPWAESRKSAAILRAQEGAPPPAARTGSRIAAGALRRSFGFCHTGGGVDCVVDGDTFWIGGEKIRIADVDAPETHPPRCAREAELGNAATRRLQALLNAGPVTLAVAGRDTDRYGRKLRIVMRGQQSIGEMLVDEGLARRWTGHREPWC
jgi:endonuclease YncB( thermonuclease family)